VTMRQSHAAGDKLFVDQAGDGVPVVIAGPLESSERRKPSWRCSAHRAFTYAQATWAQGLADWISAHSARLRGDRRRASASGAQTTPRWRSSRRVPFAGVRKWGTADTGPVDRRASREPRPGPSVFCRLAPGFLTLVPVEPLAFRGRRRYVPAMPCAVHRLRLPARRACRRSRARWQPARSGRISSTTDTGCAAAVTATWCASSRNALDWTDRVPSIVEALRSLPAASAQSTVRPSPAIRRAGRTSTPSAPL
jgi:hypothetical protein